MGAVKFPTGAEVTEDEERQQGMEQGLEQGAAALRSVLERLLVKRFGALPTGASATISAAPIEQLTEWIERAMEVDSTDVLFAPAPPQSGGAPPDPAALI